MSTGENEIVTGSYVGFGELLPPPCPEGGLIERTTRDLLLRGSGGFCPPLYFSDSALSEHDVIATYADTLKDAGYIRSDPIDGRGHEPLGIEVLERSFAWSPGYAQDFVIVELRLTNIGVWDRQTGSVPAMDLRNVFIGLHVWPTVIDRKFRPQELSSDDLCGFVRSAISSLRPEVENEVNMLWVADNDGDPEAGGFDRSAVTGVLGISMLRLPTPQSQVSFNWWTGNLDRSKDWGPVRRTSTVQYPHSGLGSPLGDRAKYQLMSNGEIDYPQVETAISHEGSGWFPPPSPPSFAEEVARGWSIRAVLSVGPFDLPFGSSVTCAFAIVGGERFHTDPNNLAAIFNAQAPEAYLQRLDFSDLFRNAQWASWIYDNPGVDTDGDGYAGRFFIRNGDTVYYRGDGEADLRGVIPPTPPRLRFRTREGRIILNWNGRRTETDKDLFTLRADFEGYRVYMSRTGRADDWVFLTQRDLVNYARYTWNKSRGRWDFVDPPFTLDSLKVLYDTLTERQYGFPFDPDRFARADLEQALLEVRFDPAHPERLDSIYRYFQPFEANSLADDPALARAAEAGMDITGVIRKVSPGAAPDSIAYREDGSPFAPYYEYEYVLTDLQVAEPVFIAVTAFDHGDPASDLGPLESAQSVTSTDIWPINSAEVIREERPKPGVYPNPYRISDYYNAAGWENPRGLEPDPERARKVTFTNVPDTCVVSIWSIDGDLVRRLEHRADPSSSEATVVVWNLITRNTQAVKTGIYIYSIESRFGTDVGKLVIVK